MRKEFIVRTATQRGYTLLELCVTLFIICLTAALVFPLVAGRGRSTSHKSCASNLKQIGVAALMYAHDYDNVFPPDYQGDGITSLFWLGVHAPFETKHDGFLSPYINLRNQWYCPDTEQYSASDEICGAPYLNNDLAAGAAVSEIATPGRAVLMMDGENPSSAMGHAYQASGANSVVWNTDHTPAYGLREVVSRAAVRHNGSANYLLADGHVECLTPDTVFFPPRQSQNRAGIANEGPQYKATFHLR